MSELSEQKASFEKMTDDNRYDQGLRLIFADWLEEHGFDDEAVEQRRRASDEWCAAARWLEDFAKNVLSHDGEDEEYGPPYEVTFDRLLDAAKNYHIAYKRGLIPNDWITLPFDTPDEVFMEREKFWENVATVLGVTLGDDQKYENPPVNCGC